MKETTTTNKNKKINYNLILISLICNQILIYNKLCWYIFFTLLIKMNWFHHCVV